MRSVVERYRSHLALAASFAFYALGFPVLHATVGGGAGSAVIVPVIVAAWSFGLPVLLTVSAVSGLALPLLYLAVGDAGGADPRTGVSTAVSLAIIGWVVFYARESRRKIDRLMGTDRVTGLLNRTTFPRELDQRLRTDPSAGQDLVLVDIIQLRQATEPFGHDAGDAILRSIAERLRTATGSTHPIAPIARTGSEEFRFCVPARGTPQEVAEAAHENITAPFTIDGTEIIIEARVAVARYPLHASDAPELVQRVESALEEAIATRRTTIVATARSEKERLSRLETVVGLRTAIATGGLVLHYQPILELPSTNIAGVEALIRWQHPERGLLAPGAFITIAEQTGLIVPLTTWVLNEALRQSRAWSDAGRPIRISVNIGAKALTKNAALATTLSGLLRSYGVDPALLALEVTESDIMVDAEQAIACLTELKALGVRIEVDDFGTGYSSLAYLQKLPLDAVKIDRSFITPLFLDPATSAIVRAAIELSHALGLETIAEGVEDQPVVEMIGAMGCDFAQGFVFARPMPPDKLITWIASRAAVDAPRMPLDPMPAVPRVVGSPGTVLVVDDEHPFRLSAHRILSAQGYKVLHAATASEALRLCATHHGGIDLVLTDIYLTDWQGPKLAAHLRGLYPSLRVMFMSGDPSGGILAGADTFLAKPFSKLQLVDGIADALAS